MGLGGEDQHSMQGSSQSTKAFKHIQSGELNLSIEPEEANRPKDAIWTAEFAWDALQSDYLKPELISDPILKRLEQYTEEWSPDQHKAPYTSLIGPTLCGKTRLLMELGKQVCVVYICLRPAKETSGIPSRSILANDMLRKYSPVGLQRHYSMLLTAILKAVKAYFLQANISKLNQVEQLKAWSAHSFPKDGTTDNGELAVEVEEIMMEQRRTIRKHKAMEIKDTERTIPDGGFLDLLRTVDEIRRLDVFSGKPLKVLLAIDQARTLLDREDDIMYNSRPLHVVLSDIHSRSGIFALFTDVTPCVAKFPQPVYDPSGLCFARGSQLFEPIYRISTLDLLAEEPKTWKDLIQPSRLLKYGLPFYSLYFDSSLKKRSLKLAIDDVVMTAQNKLLNGPQAHNNLSESQIFALLGPTIQPPLHPVWELNTELLSNHAAHCMYIDPDQTKIYTKYPSQPIYASAALKFLELDDRYWVQCINALTSAVQRGFTSEGDAGELASRVILIYAMQQAMKKHQRVVEEKGGDLSSLMLYGHPVRLEDFLEALTGNNIHELCAGLTLDDNERGLLENGYVFFNHFIRITYTPKVENFLHYLYRGLAVQCKSGQDGFDQLFTIYLKPDLLAPHSLQLEKNHITFCGIYMKKYTPPIDWNEHDQWTPSFAEKEDFVHPYLVILFDLRGPAPKIKEPYMVLHHHLKKQVLMHFDRLSRIKCLTPDMIVALEKLMESYPSLMQALEGDPSTQAWLRSVDPGAYLSSD